MVTKKKSTRPINSEQPVRFYKFVALGFLFLTVVLLALIVFMSSKRAAITIMTRPEPVQTTFRLATTDTPASEALQAMVSSTVVEVSRRFEPQGSTEEPGVAEGTVTIFNERSAAQPLVATTRLLTPDGILFRLKDRVLVPAGGSIEAAVYADEAGPSGDIGPSEFSIPGLSPALQQLVYAKSTKPMSGGMRTIGVVSQTDVNQAEQVLLEEAKSLGIERLTLPDKRSVYTVAQHVVESDAQVGKESNGFTMKLKATIVGVSYNETALLEEARSQLARQIVDNNEIVHETSNLPTVVIQEFNLADKSAVLEVSFNGLVSLDPNSKDIQKMIFYGKTEDEVRRYVLSLDHVTGVNISFRPFWNKSVPHVSDHVEVVVRQVE